MADIIDFRTRRHIAIADKLQRIALSGEEAAEVQQLMQKGWIDKTIMNEFEEEYGADDRHVAQSFFESVRPRI